MPTQREIAVEWERLAGMRCVCPAGCTDKRWGDGNTCRPDCRPCTRMAGHAYYPPPKGKKVKEK